MNEKIRALIFESNGLALHINNARFERRMPSSDDTVRLLEITEILNDYLEITDFSFPEVAPSTSEKRYQYKPLVGFEALN